MDKFMRLGLAAVVAAPLLLNGCMATKVDLAKFRDADLQEAEIMPSRDQLNSQRTKIVVFEPAEDNLPSIRGAAVAASFAKAVEQELSAAGAEIVDRNLALKLSDELRLAESKGSGSYSGPEVAQFAIRTKLTSGEYGARYEEASQYTDKKGKTHTTPASYSHRAQVRGSVGVYELPSLRLLTLIAVEGVSTASDPVTGANAATGASMLRAAAEIAVRKSGHELKNLFAPKGYVVERRVDGENKSIFKVLMGRVQGVKGEDKVVILSLRRKTNALTGKEQLDEVPVVEAQVSDQLTDAESWVVPEDKVAATRVRLGDFVRVKYEKKYVSTSQSVVVGKGAETIAPPPAGTEMQPYRARTIDPVSGRAVEPSRADARGAAAVVGTALETPLPAAATKTKASIVPAAQPQGAASKEPVPSHLVGTYTCYRLQYNMLSNMNTFIPSGTTFKLVNNGTYTDNHGSRGRMRFDQAGSPYNLAVLDGPFKTVQGASVEQMNDGNWRIYLDWGSRGQAGQSCTKG